MKAGLFHPVTAHAIERFVERVLGEKVNCHEAAQPERCEAICASAGTTCENIRDVILQYETVRIALANGQDMDAFIGDGMRAVIKNGLVVTISATSIFKNRTRKAKILSKREAMKRLQRNRRRGK